MVKITEWEFSNEEDQSYIPPEEGYRHLLIKGASLDEENLVYRVEFQDLQNEAEFSIRYWMNKLNDSNVYVPDRSQRGTLVTLGHAVLGTEKGIPFPEDIIGGVVAANLMLKASTKNPDKFYPRIYKYLPVTAEWACLGSIDQFTVDSEEAF